jgi:hypothetical protein
LVHAVRDDQNRSPAPGQGEKPVDFPWWSEIGLACAGLDGRDQAA